VTKRNLQDWSATAEILSSVAVLATLVFFVVEIQQTNDAVRANTYQGMAAMTVDFNSQFFENPEVAQFIARTASEDYELAPDEAIRLRAMISASYRMANNIWFQYEVGTITEQQMECGWSGRTVLTSCYWTRTSSNTWTGRYTKHLRHDGRCWPLTDN
jgi:hypothetical protein